MEDTQTLILTELRSLRKDFSSFAQETGERISSLEVHVKTGITGNGQPSRLQVLEDAVSRLSQWRWWVIGCTAGCCTVVSVLAWIIK